MKAMFPQDPRRLLLMCVLLSGVGGYMLHRFLDRHMVSGILNISSLPWSVYGISCQSPPCETSDVLTDCDLSLEPQDLCALLGGYPYAHEDIRADPRPIRSGYTGDAPFKVAHIYKADLRGSDGFQQRGDDVMGSVTVYVDATKTRVRVSLYKE